MLSENDNRVEKERYLLMKRNFGRKLLGLSLAACMVLSLGACGGVETETGKTQASSSAQTEAASAAESTAAQTGGEKEMHGNIEMPLAEGAELTIWAPILETNVTDYDTNALTVWYEEMTGVHINWITCQSTDREEKFNLLMASGDYPDIIMNNNIKASQVMQYKDLVFRPLNDLIDAGYAPNYKAFLDSADPAVVDALTAPDGNIYGFPYLEMEKHMLASNKMFVNKDWLDKLNLEIPKTTEEFKDMLIAFRDNDPDGNGAQDQVALTGSPTGWGTDPTSFIMSAFVIPGKNYMMADENGNITFNANSDAWREGLKYMNDLYKEGLIGEEVFTQDSTQLNSLVQSGTVGAVASAWQGVFADNVTVPYSAYVPLLPVKGPEGVQGTATNSVGGVNQVGFRCMISSSCKNPELAIQWIDYFMSDEGLLKGFYGTEGVDYNTVDEPGLNGITPGIELIEKSSTEATNTTWGSWNTPWIPKEEIYYLTTAPEGSASQLLYDAAKQYEPYMVYTGFPIQSWSDNADLIAEETELNTTITDFIKSATAEFVVGRQDINDDAAWQAYCDQLKTLGVDRWVEITAQINFAD